MKQTIALLYITVCVLYSCSKVETSQQKEEIFNTDSTFYQKDILYDGLKGGQIDSIVSRTYDPDYQQLKNIEIKRYNREGYIISNENRVYNASKLSSAGHIAYTRGQNSLVTSQLTNYLSNMGVGYTKQYKLISREFNKEIWEYINKMPNQPLTLAAEIREYSAQEMSIFSQVGQTDSTTLSIQYIYNSANLISDIYYYSNNRIVNSAQIEYNEFNVPSQTVKKELWEDETKTTFVEKFEYLYDANDNPTEIKVYQDNKMKAIIENSIYYNN